MKYRFSRKPKKCPVCNSLRIANILYGLPADTNKIKEEVKEGLLVFGGCCITNDDPEWQCTKCQTTLYRKKQKKR